MPKNKKSALAQAAKKRLERIGPPRPNEEQIAHMMIHAEERGDAQRVTLENGSWAWVVRDRDGKSQILVPTPAMLEALERFEREGHPAH